MTTQSLPVCRCPMGYRPGHLYLCGYFLRVWKVKLKEDTFHFRAWCLLPMQTILRGTGVKRMRKTEVVTGHRPWVLKKRKSQRDRFISPNESHGRGGRVWYTDHVSWCARVEAWENLCPGSGGWGVERKLQLAEAFLELDALTIGYRRPRKPKSKWQECGLERVVDARFQSS